MNYLQKKILTPNISYSITVNRLGVNTVLVCRRSCVSCLPKTRSHNQWKILWKLAVAVTITLVYQDQQSKTTGKGNVASFG